jgi:hypothetical protein
MRPAAPSAAGERRISRFPREVFPYMHGVLEPIPKPRASRGGRGGCSPQGARREGDEGVAAGATLRSPTERNAADAAGSPAAAATRFWDRFFLRNFSASCGDLFPERRQVPGNAMGYLGKPEGRLLRAVNCRTAAQPLTWTPRRRLPPVPTLPHFPRFDFGCGRRPRWGIPRRPCVANPLSRPDPRKKLVRQYLTVATFGCILWA